MKSLREKGHRGFFHNGLGREGSSPPLESQFLGWPFALLRLSLVVLFALIMGILMDWVGDEPAKMDPNREPKEIV
jgi:hypothetical protein